MAETFQHRNFALKLIGRGLLVLGHLLRCNRGMEMLKEEEQRRRKKRKEKKQMKDRKTS